jgi:hypothetical protein
MMIDQQKIDNRDYLRSKFERKNLEHPVVESMVEDN